MSLGINNQNWMGVPYAMPNMNFNTGFNFSPFGPTTSSSSSRKEEDKKPMTYEEFHKKWLKDKETKAALEEQIKLAEETKKADADIIKRGKSGKQNEDGTITVKETKEEFKKVSGWKKFGRALTNVVDGAINCGMDMFGIEGFLPPKVNMKKLGKALLGIGAVALATCIPVVGPFVVPTLLTAGLGLGGGKILYGIGKGMKTDNPEEFDKVTKGVGEGAVIAGLSAFGVRAQGGFAAMWRSAKSLASSQTLLSKASWKEGFSKLINPIKNFFSPKAQQAQFRADMHNVQGKIDTRIQEIDTQLGSTTLTDSQRFLLTEEKTLLEAQTQQLRSSNTMADWANIKNNSETKNEITNLKDVLKSLKKGENINLTDNAGNPLVLEGNAENVALVNSMNARNKSLLQELTQLADKRNAMMKRMAFSGKGKAHVKAYTGSNSKIGQLYNLTKPNIDWNWKLLYKAPWYCIKQAFIIPCKPYNWYYSLCKKGSTMPYNIEQTVSPHIESGMIAGLLTGFGINMGGEKVLTKAIAQKDENGNVVQQQTAVTKDLLAQLEEEQKKYDDTIKQLKEEKKKLSA